MKRTLVIMSLLLNVFVAASQLNEGYFQYDIELQAMDDTPQTKQTISMFRNSKMEMFFVPNKTRINFIMGQFSTTSIIVDRKKKMTLSLSDSYFGKKAILTNAIDDSEGQNQSVKIHNDRRVILGYNCYRAEVTSSDGVTSEYWLTDSIKIDKESQKILNHNLPGFPVQFSKIDDGVKMTFQLTNMKKTVDNSDEVFSVEVPAGYELIKQ